ncbi:5-carboxymethyl-2-hydroxymuconate isomerase [Pokkaliibacter plantistimulans]|uniref:5-carboxymethyl-2-hydroxymuconate isomerase n=1 Tax=Proteobacteria bacterium 228 TaxID=2083153 RepID=A0A2S5KX47_9PROT|nr:5-carboxymethyl-2-hydroxymuconate Delta-isomerase [Pokkaliibacter plantistimulans]PPC79350.1 5-carboxymethyl-2-hydroxymuconate isomerase [Pokkaliibacter plantistimulans]
MPHFIIDYSANLHDRLDFQPLFKALHEYVVSTGYFPLGGVRSRAIRCDDYRVADGREEFAYLNLSLKIGHGRDMTVKQQVAEQVFAILTDWLAPVTDQHYVAVSFELTELDPVLKFNRNNIHPLFK